MYDGGVRNFNVMFKQRHEEDQATKLVVIWKKVGVQFAGKKKQYVDKFQEMEKRDREEVKNPNKEEALVIYESIILQF